MEPFLIIVIGLFLLVFLQMLFFVSRYIKCPPDKMIVIFGRISEDPNQKYLIKTSGAVFVWPVIQDYVLMDMSPQKMAISAPFQLSNNEDLTIQINLVTSISKDENVAKKAVDLFYGKKETEILALVEARLKNKIEKVMYKKSKKELEEQGQGVKMELEKTITDELLVLGMELITMQDVEFK